MATMALVRASRRSSVSGPDRLCRYSSSSSRALWASGGGNEGEGGGRGGKEEGEVKMGGKAGREEEG